MRNRFHAVDLEIEDEMREMKYVCDVTYSVVEQEDNTISIDIERVRVTGAFVIFNLDKGQSPKEVAILYEEAPGIVNRYVELFLDIELNDKCNKHWNEAKWETVIKE